MKAWRAYNSFAKSFTPDNIRSIWETGHVLDQYLKDDDKSKDFGGTLYSKWKQNTGLMVEVLNKVFNSYPGNIAQEAKEDLQNISQSKPLSDSEIDSEVNRLTKEFTFKIDNKSICLIFNKHEKQDKDLLRQKL